MMVVRERRGKAVESWSISHEKGPSSTWLFTVELLQEFLYSATELSE